MLHVQGGRAWSRLVSLGAAFCIVIAHSPPAAAERAGGAWSSLPGNLNLGSIRRTASAPPLLTSPVTIVNGKSQQTVTAGMALTPAQAVAVAQVLANGIQSVELGVRGNAVGGSVDLTGVQNIASLRVPGKVSVIQNVAVSPSLVLSGNLINSGAIYAVSTDGAVSNAILSANNIRNNAGALITSVFPSGGLSGISGAITNLSLSLIASDSIFNAGTISSAGHLNLVAGNQIVNSVPAGATGQSLMAALGNVNLATQSLVNSGTIQAGANINVSEQVVRNADLAALMSTSAGQSSEAAALLSDVHNLLVDNTGGVLKALGGAITFDHAHAAKGDLLWFSGGDLLSQVVNADAGAGQLALNVNNLTGTLNIRAGSAVAGSLSDLKIGSTNVLGDPTYFSAMSLTVPALDLQGEGISLFAGQNVIVGSATVRSRNTLVGGTGFNINIVAGANLVLSLPAPPSPLDTDGQFVQVTGPSVTGGNITCTTCTIDSGSTASQANGAKILLAAFHNPAPGQETVNGAITIGGTIDSSATSGKAGDVTVIAPNHITLTTVTMNATVPGATLKVINAQPKGSLKADFHGNATGSIQPGALTGVGQITLNGTISPESGKVIMNAGIAGLDMSSASGIRVNAFQPGTAGGSVTLTSASNIHLAGFIFADGFPGAPGAGGLSAGAAGAAGSKGGKGGTIAITAAGTINDDVTNQVDLSAHGANGGNGGGGVAGDASKLAGGAGGKGAAGGAGGTISLTADTINLNLADSEVATVNAGNGGSGGSGGPGAASGGIAGAGGKGGSGGSGGKGGTITLKATSSAVDLTTSMVADGGGGGAPGLGADGGSVDTTGAKGGNGGASGKGGTGGGGGKIAIQGTGANPISISSTTILQVVGEPGGGDSFDPAGDGGTGLVKGGLGGNGAVGGKGGKGGTISISSTNGSITIAGHLQTFSTGASGGGPGGRGGDSVGGGVGGAGGKGGNAGATTAAGKITIKSGTGTITITGSELNAKASDGGFGGNGGQGGSSSGQNGNGGNGGNGTNGGNGGNITLSAPVITGTVSPTQVKEGSGQPGGNGGSDGTGTGTSGKDGIDGRDGIDGKPGHIITDASTGDDDQAPAWKRSKSRGARVGRLARADRNGPSQEDPYRPVSFVQPALMLTDRSLQANNVLLVPDRKDITATAEGATVCIARGAAAFLVSNGRDISVHCLHERATGDVRVVVGSQEIALRAGEQALITGSSALEFADLNPTPAIACRKVKERYLGAVRALICEFSIASAMDHLTPLKGMAHSPRSHDRAVYAKVLKNAAILNMLTARKGPYKTLQRTVITAQAL